MELDWALQEASHSHALGEVQESLYIAMSMSTTAKSYHFRYYSKEEAQAWGIKVHAHGETVQRRVSQFLMPPSLSPILGSFQKISSISPPIAANRNHRCSKTTFQIMEYLHVLLFVWSSKTVLRWVISISNQVLKRVPSSLVGPI